MNIDYVYLIFHFDNNIIIFYIYIKQSTIQKLVKLLNYYFIFLSYILRV